MAMAKQTPPTCTKLKLKTQNKLSKPMHQTRPTEGRHLRHILRTAVLCYYCTNTGHGRWLKKPQTKKLMAYHARLGKSYLVNKAIIVLMPSSLGSGPALVTPPKPPPMPPPKLLAPGRRPAWNLRVEPAFLAAIRAELAGCVVLPSEVLSAKKYIFCVRSPLFYYHTSSKTRTDALQTE
jgi:hypothetical protein